MLRQGTILEIPVNNGIIHLFRPRAETREMKLAKDVGLILLLAILWFGPAYYAGTSMWFGESDHWLDGVSHY